MQGVVLSYPYAEKLRIVLDNLNTHFESSFYETFEKDEAKRILKQLKEQGEDTGKPLSGLSFFREKKFDGKRLYYLVYKDSNHYYTAFVLLISSRL